MVTGAGTVAGTDLTSGLFPGLSLAQLTPEHCLSEMEFCCRCPHLSAAALNRCLAAGDPLSAQAPALAFNEVQGMLKGFIDLVFEHDGRFYVVDYKSNYLGDNAAAYQQDAMAQAMIEHRLMCNISSIRWRYTDICVAVCPMATMTSISAKGLLSVFARHERRGGQWVYATKPDKTHIGVRCLLPVNRL